MQAEETFDKSMNRAMKPTPLSILEGRLLLICGFYQCGVLPPPQVLSYLLPTCYPPTEHPTVLCSEARVKHLGLQDKLSP